MMQPETAPTVRWGEWISEGWQMFAERWQVWVPQFLILFLICAIVFAPVYAWSFSAQITAAQTGEPPQPPAILIPFLLIAMPVLFLVIAFLWSGLWNTAFKQLRGEPISVTDLFSGGGAFLQVLGAFIMLIIMGGIGALLCFFPALIVNGLFHFTIPLIIERRMGVGSALGASFEATKKHWLMFTLFTFVVGIIASLGQIACFIGLLATYPLQITIMAIAYRDVFGMPGARSFAAIPAVTSTSYAGQSWPSPAQQPAPPQPLFAPPPVQPPPEVQPQPAQTRCPQCGATLTRVTNFCNFCGVRLQQ